MRALSTAAVFLGLIVAACAGLPYGLSEATRILQEVDRPVLLVCGEKFSDKIGTVRTSRMIFGDGAAAMVLTWLDYAVISVYLLAIVTFGSWFARFQKTTRDYFLTGRSVPWWAICFTIVATETSTLTFIGVPASAYAGNWTFLQLAAGYVIAAALAWRKQSAAVEAIEGRDGVRFYVEQTSPFKPTRLIRTPGFRRVEPITHASASEDDRARATRARSPRDPAPPRRAAP